ncbi:MAG: glucose-6-phosphate isomerase [Armatimonadetes bacterium]|nr:glucose-6-phosphate isomerase [Armatimonadota bacterium]
MKLYFSEKLELLKEKYKNECRNMRGEFLLKLNAEGFPFSNFLGGDLEKYEEIKSILPHYENVVVLGIGGSALGTKMIHYAFPELFDKNLYVLDTTDPKEIDLLLKKIYMEKTIFISISKSGSTIETAALTLFFIERLEKVLNDNWKNRMVFITDPFKGNLREFVNENGLTSLDIPPELGGRYSVLSNVGLFPLYLAGFPIEKLLNGAKNYLEEVKKDNILDVFDFAYCNFHFYNEGFNILNLFSYIGRLKLFGEWFVQLFAESLGKKNEEGENVGQTPMINIGPTDQHSIIQLFNDGPKDKVILFLKEKFHEVDFEIKKHIDKSAFSYLYQKSFGQIIDVEYEGAMQSLTNLDVPNATLEMDKLSPENLGKLIVFSYVFTVFSSMLLKVNPFDQPGVENGKKIMYKKLGREGY